MSLRSIRPARQPVTVLSRNASIQWLARNSALCAQSVRENSTQAPNPRHLVFRSEAVAKEFNDFGRFRITPRHHFTDEAVSESPALVALHARIGLPKSFPLSTLARALTCHSADMAKEYPENRTLAEVGYRLLDYYVSEWIVTQYPRLPASITNELLWAYTGDEALTKVAEGWGVEIDAAVNQRGDSIPTPLPDAYGVLKFTRVVKDKQGGLVEYRSPKEKKSQRYANAMGQLVRSVVAGVQAHENRPAVKSFIQDHILSRFVDVSKLFRFEQPTVELSRLCAREGFEGPVSRMISETGRLSKSPVFIVGVYAGSNLLGSGEGSSIKEAEIRAAISALKAWYLYSPAVASLPSVTEDDATYSFTPNYIDRGEIIV